MVKLKPCPCCGTAWIYASKGDYASGYEAHGYKIQCNCGYAWTYSEWRNTSEDAAWAWNGRQPVPATEEFTMIEYIERAALFDDAVQRGWVTLDEIINVPAADVAPVVHGRWFDVGSLSCQCSVCGCKSNEESRWCPNCGAKMDEKEDTP